MLKKLLVFVFCIAIIGNIYAEDINSTDLNISPEDFDEMIENIDVNITDMNQEDINELFDEYDVNYEDVNKYIEDLNIDYEDINDIFDEHDVDYEDVEQYIQDQDINDILSEIITPSLIINTLYSNLDFVKEMYNQEIILEIPEFVKNIYSNESYKIVFIIEDQEKNLFLDFEEEYLENLSQNQIREKVDLSIYISEHVFETFLNIDDFQTEEEIVFKIREHIINKDIDLKPHGFINSIKYSVFNILRFMLSF
jgi:hypothetical protein